MKRSIAVTLAVVLAVAVGAGRLLAADRDEGAEGNGDKAAHVERMLEHMKRELGLSDADAAKVKSAFEEQRKTVEPLHRELKVGLEKLRWQVDAKADPKDLEATLSQLDKTRKALFEQHEKLIEKLRGSLSVEAQAKLALFKAERMHRMHAMHGMMMRFHRGWGGPEGRGPEGMRESGHEGKDHGGPDRDMPPPPHDEDGE